MSVLGTFATAAPLTSAVGTKQTSRRVSTTSAFDPKRKFGAPVMAVFCAQADVIALNDLLPHHLAVDQLEGLGRDADLAPKWMIEQDDQANHCTGEEGDKPTQ
jgi:hypothetical protein